VPCFGDSSAFPLCFGSLTRPELFARPLASIGRVSSETGEVDGRVSGTALVVDQVIHVPESESASRAEDQACEAQGDEEPRETAARVPGRREEGREEAQSRREPGAAATAKQPILVRSHDLRVARAAERSPEKDRKIFERRAEQALRSIATSVLRGIPGPVLLVLLVSGSLTPTVQATPLFQATRLVSDGGADPEGPEGQATSPPAPDAGKISLGGYIEAFYSFNFNDPSNRITNFRGFDNRESTFTLSNVAGSLAWEKSAVSAKITAQVGHTPDTYYLSEPTAAGTSSTPATSASTTWKYLQEAWLGYKAPVGNGLLIQGGLFLSPIGIENMPIKDNWNWSRSNLFFGLPFYHAGVRATYELSKSWTTELMVCNGWNDIVDNNRQKSVYVAATHKPSETFNVHLLYFGGVERPTGAPEGAPWRHLFDAYATWDATKTLSFALNADGGFEQNNFGTSDWAAAAAYARFKIARTLFLAARADLFHEHAALNSSGSASRIFWPGDRVASQTLTLDYRPLDNISIRLEGRHDSASTEMYFRGQVSGDGSTGNPYVPNGRSQTTLTLGATAWF
jgi:hypothetical protein